MGFFKEFKQDLSQAVSELTDDAAKMAMDDVTSDAADDEAVFCSRCHEENEAFGLQVPLLILLAKNFNRFDSNYGGEKYYG